MVTATLRPAVLSDAGTLFLKLAAFAIMIAGHADWFLAGADLGIHDTIGRAVFPAFAVVLALNLQRIRGDRRLYRIAARLAVAAGVSLVPYAYLQGAWVPVNILGTYAVALLCLALWRSGLPTVAAVVFLVGGLVVDYAWFGVASVLFATWAFGRGMSPLLVASVICVLLVPINGSMWSLLVLPLLAAGAQLQGSSPRLKWLFYVGYPVHLLFLALLRIAGV